MNQETYQTEENTVSLYSIARLCGFMRTSASTGPLSLLVPSHGTQS